MTLNLEQIVEHRERLRREIVERECLLAAFNVLHGYMANGQPAKAFELGSLASALLPGLPAAALLAHEIESAPESPALPPPPPEPRYVHPELQAIGHMHGCNVQYVKWAIQRMTDDYSLRDIATLLRREGYWMKGAEISVVLTRLKNRGEIEEVIPAHGPIPSVFRKPASASPPEPPPTDLVNENQATTESAAAA